MVSILGAFNNQSVGQTMSALANTAARPNFELQFSILQNTLLDQMSVKIEDLQKEKSYNRIDAFLDLERKSLMRSLPHVAKYGKDTEQNKAYLIDMKEELDNLNIAIADGDADAFDSAISRFDKTSTQKVLYVSGNKTGIHVKDGLMDLRSDGSGFSDYASYADNDARKAAVSELMEKVDLSIAILNNNLDTAYEINDRIQSKLTSINLQIVSTNAASDTEFMSTIEKLRQENANFLKSVSISFEVAQSNAQALSDNIFKGYKPPIGSVLNMFT